MLTLHLISYVAQNWLTIARNAAQYKHQKYYKAAEYVRGSFTAVISTADGVTHKCYFCFQKRISEPLARKEGKT